MDMTRLNPLVYTDVHPFDDFEPDGTTEAVAETVSQQRYALQRAALRKALAREWERIKRQLMSPKQREIAMTQMAETPHDFNLILYDDAAFPSSYDEDEDESDARGRMETVLAPYVKPGAINVAVEKDSLKDVAGGGITSGKKGEAKLVRSARESIYTAHTILHRIGDDRQPRLAPNMRWWGWKKFTPEYMQAYVGKPYVQALTEAVMRAAGLYLSEPERDSLFAGRQRKRRDGKTMERTLVTAAQDRIGGTLSLPVALLATDPKIVKAFVQSRRERFKGVFGYQPEEMRQVRVSNARSYSRRYQTAEGPVAMLPWDEQCKQLTRDVASVLANIREALIYGSGTTWISRQGIAGDSGQVMADTMPQTEIYGGTKFLVPAVIGRSGPSDRVFSTTHLTVGNKDVPIPPDIHEEVQAAMRPVELAFDAYNTAVLDSLVGKLTRI
jgi:hypothetical protein